LDKHGIKPNVQFSTMDIQATYAMAAAGMGVSITNQINSLPDYEGVCHRKLVPAELIEMGEESVTDGRKIFGIYQNRRSDAINIQFVMETIKIVLSSGSMIY